MRCFVCPAVFRTRTAASDLAKHLQTTHSGAMNEQQMAQYTKFITSHPMSNDGKPIHSTSGKTMKPNTLTELIVMSCYMTKYYKDLRLDG